MPEKGEKELTVLNVEEGNKHGEQSCHGNLTHQLPVAMVGTECESAFAQVSQTLQTQTAESQYLVIHMHAHFLKVHLHLIQGAFCFATHLSQSHHEEIVRIFGVILRQLPQHSC